MRSRFTLSCFGAGCCLFLGAIFGSACVSDDASDVPGVLVQAGFSVELVADGFDRPTQIAMTTEGDLIVGQLAGEEDSAQGEILLVDLNSGQIENRVVLQTGLAKPTGVAVIGETLWIMQERSLSFASLIAGDSLQPYLTDLPFNGRSEGSLTVTQDGSLLFNTSGSKRGSDVVEGSGTIFMVEDGDPIGNQTSPGSPVVIATGLKHGYAHTIDSVGQLWATEMTDGLFDELPASDELMKVSVGDNFDWPACVENNRPVRQFGGSPERCSLAPPSHALFGAQATPTSVKVAPWDPEILVITLWVPDQVVLVPVANQANDEPWKPVELASGIGRPQDLLVDGSRLLLVDHEGGRILTIGKK